MKGNFYVSGRLGSNATSNPLPATPSTTTTRTHNHLQSHILFANSAATAALQNNRDDPHLAGNEACLCSSCHIKDSFFPRSQDGRIVLPHPTTISALSNSTRRHRHTASMTTPSSSASTHKRNRANSTASNRDPKFNEGRRGAVLSTPQLQGDNAEGSFGGFGRIPVMAGESLPHGSLANEDTPQMHELEGRPFSGPSRRTQKYDHKPKRKRPDPWPRIPEPEDFSGQSTDLNQQSSSSSGRSRLELLDKHGIAHPRNPQEMSFQTINLETPRPSIHLTVPQTYINYEHLSSPHQGTFDVSMSSYPETGRMETSHHHHHPRHHSTNTSLSESLTGGDIIQDETNTVTIKFSSRSKNSQSFDNNPTPTTSGERSVNSSPIREQRPSSSHLLQSQTEEDGSGGSVQTQFRFQEPLVPEDQTTSTGTSPVHTRELSVVNVKWDSERKRRQGYFAQEEGAEKSPFRHYNKSNCDFES